MRGDTAFLVCQGSGPAVQVIWSLPVTANPGTSGGFGAFDPDASGPVPDAVSSSHRPSIFPLSASLKPLILLGFKEISCVPAK